MEDQEGVGLNEILFEKAAAEYPYPLAHLCLELRACEDWMTRIHLYPKILGLCIQFTALCLLAEYQAVCPCPVEWEKELSKPLSHGQWLGLIRRVGLAIEQSQIQPLQASWLSFSKKNSPLYRIYEWADELVTKRNDLIKRCKLNPTRQDFKIFDEKLQLILQELHFLIQMPMVLTGQARIQGHALIYQVQWLMGSQTPFRRKGVQTIATLESAQLFAFCLNRSGILALDPWMIFTHCSSCQQEHFFLFEYMYKGTWHYSGLKGCQINRAVQGKHKPNFSELKAAQITLLEQQSFVNTPQGNHLDVPDFEPHYLQTTQGKAHHFWGFVLPPFDQLRIESPFSTLIPCHNPLVWYLKQGKAATEFKLALKVGQEPSLLPFLEAIRAIKPLAPAISGVNILYERKIADPIDPKDLKNLIQNLLNDPEHLMIWQTLMRVL